MLEEQTGLIGDENEFNGVTTIIHDLLTPHSHYEKRAKSVSSYITAWGNFSVQYNFQAVAVSLLLMSASVCTLNDDGECKEGVQATWVAGTMTASVFLGAIAGQLSMGYIGDLLGRNIAMCITLSLAALGAVASSLFSFGSPNTIYGIIILSRFVLGVGAGGVFPLSATKAAEDSGHKATKTSSSNESDPVIVNPVAAGRACFWQAPGAMFPWFVGYLMTFINISPEVKWRLMMGLGAIPSTAIVLLTLFEMKLRNKAKFAKSYNEQSNKDLLTIELNEVDVDSEDALAQKHKTELMLQDPKYRFQLLMTGGCWFLYDIAYYGVALFGGEIINAMKNSDDDNVSTDDSIRYASTQQLIALSMGVPASIVTVFAIYHFGTKMTQVYGFFFQALAFTAMAVGFYPLQQDNPVLLFILYCILLFSLNSGPSMTTFCIPAEAFPYEIRTTYNGISAACGKLGAACGAYMFGPLADVTSYPTVMVVCAILEVMGGVISYLYLENFPTPKEVQQKHKLLR